MQGACFAPGEDGHQHGHPHGHQHGGVVQWCSGQKQRCVWQLVGVYVWV
jgi:hypothetical protein